MIMTMRYKGYTSYSGIMLIATHLCVDKLHSAIFNSAGYMSSAIWCNNGVLVDNANQLIIMQSPHVPTSVSSVQAFQCTPIFSHKFAEFDPITTDNPRVLRETMALLPYSPHVRI